MTAFDSPRSPKTRPKTAMMPTTPCTPIRPLWVQRCEEAVARCPFPSSFALLPSNKGEDRLVVDCRGSDSLWAVFDGHRSYDVAGHAAQVVPGLIWNNPWWSSSPGEAMKTALRDCHESARRERLRGGSTAALAAASGGRLWCCSAGDSRVVVGLTNGSFQRLSADHTTSAAEEIQRIEASGARLEWGRLGGCLPMTRGLGNFTFEADGFSCIAHVTSLPLHEVEFVVVASDGLWDFIGDEACCADEKCCALVRMWGRVNTAERLAAYARRVGSTDDIAVVVAFVPQGGGPGSEGGA